MKFHFIILIAICLLIASAINSEVSAHGLGGGQDKVVGNYIIDFGYSEFEPKEQDPILLTFELSESTSKKSVSFASLWIMILDQNDGLLFSGGIAQEIKGQASLTFVFPHDGSFTIRTKFNDISSTIVESDFSLDIESKNQKSSSFKKLSGKNIVVEIKDNGYEPDFISIPIGTKVTWINKGENQHWPASDMHPTHTRYPKSGIEKCGTSEEKNILDACGSLNNGEEYTFTFKRVGKWGIHDHLYPNLGMEIEVIESNSILSRFILITGNFISNLRSLFDANKENTNKITNAMISEQKLPVDEMALSIKDKCDDINRPENMDKQTCYIKEFQETAINYGPEYSFDVLKTLQSLDDYARLCHLISHGIGWGAYERNPDDWQKELSTISPTCAYGSIHGILERHIQNVGGGKLTKELLRNICNLNDPKAGCIHAIGHLILVEAKNDLDKALDLCSVFPTDDRDRDRFRCFTGVFMESMIGDNLIEHGFYPPSRKKTWFTKTDEFEKLCRSQEGLSIEACWVEIVHPAATKFRGDINKMMDFCNSAQSLEAAKACRRHSAGEILSKNNYDLNIAKKVCTIKQKDDPSWERECYIIYASSRLYSIIPQEATEVVDYCSSLDAQFRGTCFSNIGHKLRIRLIDKETISKICENAPAEFKDQCISGKFQNQYSIRQSQISSDVEKQWLEDVIEEDISAKKTLQREEAIQLKDFCDDKIRDGIIGKSTCYANKFTEITLQHGPEYAFDILFDLQEIDVDALECHFIGHGIGHGIYKRDPVNSINKIDEVNSICSYGVAMGIIELYASNFLKEKITEKESLLNICGERSICQHVIGHVLLTETSGELDKSLESCSTFPTRVSRKRCYGGVFMEYVYPTNLIAHGYANKSSLNLPPRLPDLENLCRSFDEELAEECWGNIVRAAMSKYNSDPTQVLNFCNTAQTKESARWCKLHFLSISTVQHDFNLDSFKYICTLQPNEPDFENKCYLRIVGSKLNVLGALKADEVVDFCSSLDIEFQNSCFSLIGQKLVVERSTNSREMLNICKNAPKEFNNECRGTN